MDIRNVMQSKLDKILLPFGILSHHLLRVKIDRIVGSSVAICNDEYVVYRLVSSRGRIYGDGNAKMTQYYIDVNYYYSYDKTDARVVDADKRIKTIISAFVADKRFRLVNGQSDIYDIDNPFRGINIEFLFLEVNNDG